MRLLFWKRDVNMDEEKKSFPWLEVFSAVTAALTFFTIGAIRSFTSPAIASIKQDTLFNRTLTDSDVSWIASAPPLGAFCGAILSGPLLQLLGRQRTLVFQSFPSLLGWLLVGFATNLNMMIVGRAFGGVASGLSTAAAQLYVSEFARSEIRGVLGFLPGMLLSLGILGGLIIGTTLYWRWAAFAIASVPAILLILTFTLPESPVWLLSKRRVSAATASLAKFRGRDRANQVGKEISEMQFHLDEAADAVKETRWTELIVKKELWWPSGLSLFLMMFQQLTGVSAVVMFLQSILEEAKSKSDVAPYLSPAQGTLLVGGVQFLAFFISMPLIDSLGRKVLLTVSSILMIIFHVLLGAFFYASAQRHTSFVDQTAGWLPVTSLCGFIASYSIGFAAVPFIVASEIFPTNYRSYMSSLASLVNLVFTFLVVKYFLALKNALHPGYIYFLFAAMCLIACFFVNCTMPETKGKTLGEIQTLFNKKYRSDNESNVGDDSINGEARVVLVRNRADMELDRRGSEIK